jgi:hypothetical protein
MRTIHLCGGSGDGIRSACLGRAITMAVGWQEKHLWSACPTLCPGLLGFIIDTNDTMPDSVRNEVYGPLVYELIGAGTGDMEIARQRGQYLFDRAVEITGSFEAKIDPNATPGYIGQFAAHLMNIACCNGEVEWSKCADILLEAAAIGDKRPVEIVIPQEQLAEMLS